MANFLSVAAIFNNPNVIQKYMEDQISTQNILIWWLHGKPVNMGPNGSTKITAKKFIKEQDGGSRFEVPLMLIANPNIKSFAKDDTFTITGNNAGDRAYYNIQSVGGPISLYGYDIDVCGSSKNNLIDLTKTYLEQGSLSLLNAMEAQILGTQGGEGSNDWTSLLTLFPTNPTADSIGGISSASYPNWANQYTNGASRSMATYLKSDLTSGIVAATFGKRSPNLIIMDTTVYGTLHGQLVSNQRYVPDVELAKAGFKGMEYDGASVIFDSTITTGSILGLCMESLEYGYLKDAHMKMGEFVKVPNADQMVALIVERGNIIVKDRRTNWRGYSYTTV